MAGASPARTPIRRTIRPGGHRQAAPGAHRPPCRRLHRRPPMTIPRDLLILMLLAGLLPSADPAPHRIPAFPAMPAWAAAAGDDRYGRWADLAVEGAHQRLRWIAP